MKPIHHFAPNRVDRANLDVSSLGTTGAMLREMARAGFNVPPGFTITTHACAKVVAAGKMGPGLLAEVQRALARLAVATGRPFGYPRWPLAVAVRCSPSVPVSGLMGAILNVGLPPQATARSDSAGSAQAALTQIVEAIEAACRSWNSPLAIAYRRKHSLDHLPALAVTVQAMVFGNRDDKSAAGTAFTRDPATGESHLTGEFLLCAQGPDLSAGARHPLPCADMARLLPEGWRQLLKAGTALERHYRDAQDFQFVIESGRLYLLGTRTANRSPLAAGRIAVDLAARKLIDRKTAVLRVDPSDLESLLHPAFDPAADKSLLATGLGASPGAAAGRLAFSAGEVHLRADAGESLILVRPETEAADVGAMHLATGVLTSTGGMTSHAAVVARGMGRPCIVGASALTIDARRRTLCVDGQTYGPGDWISLDGAAGEAYRGQVPIVAPELSAPFNKLLNWADGFRTMAVYANADTPHDATVARALGAQGIGLCRTEHMFFAPERIGLMRQMILAPDPARRDAALAGLLPHQRDDFAAIFKAMAGLPVIIRLLDPPLHEFLPRGEAEQRELARALNLTLKQVQQRIEQLREVNPMLGHRGDRLAVTCPEILIMQVRAIIEAACECARARVKVRPRIMTPLVATARELRHLNPIVRRTADEVMRQRGVKVAYLLGTMIEVPRAALTASEIAGEADFFSFGTNDLTQLTLGISRDDVGSFLPDYLSKKLLDADPFAHLDETGVGRLMELCVRSGRAVKPSLPLGICGEHGGDPASIAFCQRLGLHYVSCSPYRVPIARLAAAQAAIR